MSKSINVLHISTLSNIGGVELRLIEYLGFSNNPLINHYVCCTSGKDDLINQIRELEIEVFVPKRRFHYDPFAIIDMAKYMKKREIHIIHSRNCVSNCWGGLAALMANVPVKIGGEHGTIWEERGIKSGIERFNYKFFDVIVANSTASKIMVERKRDVDKTKIKVVHNAVNKAPFENIVIDADEKRREFSIRKDTKIIGSVGRLNTPKGLSVFIEAIPLILKEYENVFFMIVGDGILRSNLENMVKKKGINQYMIFTGWRNDIAEIMNMFDIYVSTSISESFGNTLVEAGLAKKPVIAPNVGGIPEIVIDGETGILIESTCELDRIPKAFLENIPTRVLLLNGKYSKPKLVEPKCLAESILFLLKNPDIAQKYGENGYNRVTKLFSIEKYAGELENIYIKLAKQKGIL